jgi:hypothetical protein
MIAVSLFDFTGNMLKPWLEAGYECHIFDIQHPQGICHRDDGMFTHGVDLRHIEWGDVLALQDKEPAFLSCFPPCTHTSISGARWMRGKGLRALEESIAYFATSVELAEYLDCPYMIENPMSTISTYWRAPDHKFHPCHYSGYVNGQENYTKETWLWTGGSFVMPPKSMSGDLFDMPDTTYIHHQAPGEDRANIRSATPMGFAEAVFQKNAPKRGHLNG